MEKQKEGLDRTAPSPHFPHQVFETENSRTKFAFPWHKQHLAAREFGTGLLSPGPQCVPISLQFCPGLYLESVVQSLNMAAQSCCWPSLTTKAQIGRNGRKQKRSHFLLPDLLPGHTATGMPALAEWTFGEMQHYEPPTH